MSDHYKEMMHFHYDPYREYGRQQIIHDPELTMAEVMHRVKRFEEEYDAIVRTPRYFADYWRLAFPKRPSLKIYPETLKRCTRSINE